MSEEKDFCTLLSEQIIDERNASKAYKRLLEMFEEERDLLVGVPTEKKIVGLGHPLLGSPEGPYRTVQDKGSWARIQVANHLEKDIDLIIKDETVHETILERIRRVLCETKEE